MRKITDMFLAALAVGLSACGGIGMPQSNVERSGSTPQLMPDYTSITIPPNIAPLNFEILENSIEYVARIKGDDTELLAEGKR